MTALALLRIEHKLDLLLQALQANGVVLPSPLPSLAEKVQDTCPVCGQFQRFGIDTQTETVILACGCRPPIHAVPGISQVGRPIPTAPRKETPDEQSSSEAEPPVPGPNGAPAAFRP